MLGATGSLPGDRGWRGRYTGEHFGVGAVWAAAVPLGAAGDGGLVFMAFVADPPDFFLLLARAVRSRC